MSSSLNIGVIGLGNMGKHHVRNYVNLSAANLVAVCDIQADIAQQFEKQYQCASFTAPNAAPCNFYNH